MLDRSQGFLLTEQAIALILGSLLALSALSVANTLRLHERQAWRTSEGREAVRWSVRWLYDTLLTSQHLFGRQIHGDLPIYGTGPAEVESYRSRQVEPHRVRFLITQPRSQPPKATWLLCGDAQQVAWMNANQAPADGVCRDVFLAELLAEQTASGYRLIAQWGTRRWYLLSGLESLAFAKGEDALRISLRFPHGQQTHQWVFPW